MTIRSRPQSGCSTLQLVAEVLRDPADALQGGSLDAVEAFLDDLDHLAGPLDLVAGVGHGGSDLVRVVVAQGLLDRLEVDFEARTSVAEHGHGVEDERMALVRGAERDDDGLRLAQVERLLPGLESQAKLVLGDDILEGLGAALVVPHLEEEGVDHDARGEGAVAQRLALEEVVMGLHEGGGRAALRRLGPGVLVDVVQVPEGLGGGQGQVLKLVEADGGRVVVGQRQQAEEDVDGVVRAAAALVLDPLGARGQASRRGLRCAASARSGCRRPCWRAGS